jgi:hypothetical protein
MFTEQLLLIGQGSVRWSDGDASSPIYDWLLGPEREFRFTRGLKSITKYKKKVVKAENKLASLHIAKGKAPRSVHDLFAQQEAASVGQDARNISSSKKLTIPPKQLGRQLTVKQLGRQLTVSPQTTKVRPGAAFMV